MLRATVQRMPATLPNLRFLATAALVTLAVSSTVAAQTTVKIGKETKRTSGVVRSVEAGDVACYLNLTDERGVAFTELAEFEICEMPALVGKRVTLGYTLGNVMADECQGDPDCTKTRTVALVSSVKVVAANPAPAKPAPAKPAPAKTPRQTSFCTPREIVVFACRTGAKLVSVCASRDASPTRGTVQYRFGKPDSNDPLELAIPAGTPIPPKAATGENVPFAGGGGSWLRFRSGPFAYVVYSGIGKWGPRGETREKQGIVVERGDKVVATLPCTGKLTSELGPEWFETVGIESNGEDFFFPD